MSHFCFSNKIICEYATSNGYCSLSACRNIRLCGNTIISEDLSPVGEIKADWNKKPSNWHTGEPTEEGWYLIKTEERIPYHTVYWKNNRWLSIDDKIYRKDIVLKWQKIED